MIMPLSMKIQPIDVRDLPEPPAKPPVVRSRLKRLFRISATDKSVTAGPDEITAPPVTDQFVEPSSLCLAKMVQNFIEDSNEKHSSSPAIKCGRHRCNCFNGNGSDLSDGETDGSDAYDFLKSSVMSANVSEKNVLADTAKIVERNGKGFSKRKDELRKSVAEGLVALGYDAGLCKSKWDKTPSFPAGEYEYVDVIIKETGERLIVDVDFRSEFEIARSTKAYKSALQMLPYIFVGKPDRLAKIVALASEAARISLKKKGLHFPPWRKAEYVQAKWLSPHTRTRLGVGPVGSLVTTKSIESVDSSDLAPSPNCEEEEGCSSMDDQPLFAMSESSGEEDVKMEPMKPKKKTMEVKGQGLDFDGPTN